MTRRLWLAAWLSGSILLATAFLLVPEITSDGRRVRGDGGNAQPSQQTTAGTRASNSVFSIDGALDAILRARANSQDGKNIRDLWNLPIEFYGKVLDEAGRPVPSARVELVWNADNMPANKSVVEKQSDSAGNFRVTGLHGTFLEVLVKKDGYYSVAPKPRTFWYEDNKFVPNPAAPEIFRLRKHGDLQPLVQFSFPRGSEYRLLPLDGTPLGVNIMTGQFGAPEDGNFVMALTQRDDDRTTRSLRGWKCVLSLQGGGILEAAEDINFLAPEEGYKPHETIDKWDGHTASTPDVAKEFYVRFPDGKYGRVWFSVRGQSGYIKLRAFVNTNGSRNLEPDPERLTRVGE